MRMSYPLLTVMVIAYLLAGCATHGQSTTQIASNFIKRQQILATTKKQYLPKSPHAIVFYPPHSKPLMPYRIIGIARVSKYNLIGLPRQDDTLQVMMKNLAASIGGDGVIHLSNQGDEIQAHVIVFQRVFI